MEVSNENSITRILEQQVIPSIIENGANYMVVACSSLKEFHRKGNLPSGMRVTRRALRSRRTKVRGRHYFGRLLVNARWEEDGLHSLRTPKLAIVLKGEITFQCGDALLHCIPGHVIFIPPDVPHPDGSHNYLEETAFPQGNCELLFMGMHAEGIAVWHSITERGEHRTNGTYRILGRQAENYLHLFWEQAVSSEKYSRRNRGALLLLLMTSVRRDIQEYQPQEITQEKANASEGDTMMRAKEYIRNHIHEKLTIDEVARHAYLSRTQFTGRFRRETGKSFHEYLSDNRFDLAKTLLLNPLNLPINRVSQRVGLKPGMLRKLFLQRVQMTPTQFRENQKKNAINLSSKK